MASECTKIFIPLHPSTKVQNDPHAELSSVQQSMYNEVLTHFTRENPAYSIPNVEKGELMEQEMFWLSRECMLRYLRASKWNVSPAIQRLETTLKWRREFGLYDLVTASHVEPEAVTGKEVLFGYDVDGRPAIYMIPSRQNTAEGARQIQFAVWMLERSVDVMEPGVETISLLINFADRGKNPSISTSMTVLHILQNHYPERLGLALIINVPFLVNAFFKFIMPLVDPITRQKVKFNPDVFEDGIFTKDQVIKEWGGDCKFEYVHDKYWTELNQLCDDRAQAWKKNWRNLGAKVGLSEWAYKTAVSTRSETEVKDLNENEKVSATEIVVISVLPNDSEVAEEPVAEESQATSGPKSTTAQADTTCTINHEEKTGEHADLHTSTVFATNDSIPNDGARDAEAGGIPVRSD